MALTYRDEKGSPLSAEEVDENFRTLVTLINSSVGDTGVGVANITQSGSTITIHLTDGSTQGPFDLPTAAFNDTGDWAAETAYSFLDLFEVPNVGLYLVLEDFTSGAEFEPNLMNTDGDPYYRLVLRTSNGPQSITEVPDPGDFSLNPTVSRNRYVRIAQDTPVLITVLDEAALALAEEEPFVVGDTVTFRQVSDGQITLAGTTDVTINTPESLTSRKAGSTITLLYVGSDVYDLAGDLELLPEEPLTTTGP
jgi:hypothetical protein